MRKELDLDKLRRLIGERRARHEAVIAATDAYLERRGEASRLQSRIERLRDLPGGASKGDQARLAALKADIDALARIRDEASARFDEYGFVDELIDYARREGVVVEEQAGIVRWPVPGESRRVEIPLH
jgi:hypothetical protein